MIEHAIASVRLGAVVADGTSTIVNYDYEAGRSIPVGDELRRGIAEMEARVGRRPEGSH